MVNTNMKKLADNSQWISRELSTSYAWWDAIISVIWADMYGKLRTVYRLDRKLAVVKHEWGC